MADEVAERVRRRVPVGLGVVPGSLPVVSFGDPSRARVATVSLNPSWIEFLSPGGEWLLGGDRRLASLRSLGVDRSEDLSDGQVAEVVADCNTYFERPTWYRAWFHWLDSLLAGSGAGSYLDGSACHLDLVQWATRPAQGELPRAAWRRLVDDDREFLAWQLAASGVGVVLLNGASIVTGLEEAGIAGDFESDVLAFATGNGRPDRLRVFRGRAGDALALGWNRPLASAVPAAGRQALLEWVTEQLAHFGVRSDRQDVPRGRETVRVAGADGVLVDGFVPIGHTVSTVEELAQVLRHWFEHSDRPTVGDVGAFGGSPVIRVDDLGLAFVVNRDTKRAAVARFLAAVDEAGGAGQLDWHVAPNARGTLNRVTYGSDDAPTLGWYAYTKDPTKGDARRHPPASTSTPAAPVSATGAAAESSPTRRAAAAGSAGPPAGEIDDDGAELHIVQFVHPGFEYHAAEHVGPRIQRAGVMAWKDGRSEHDRKFLLSRGSLLDPESGDNYDDEALTCWGEWEGPSVYWRVDSPGRPLPSLVHAPFRPAQIPDRSVQNTDPLVFGDRFVYSNCLQPHFAVLRRLGPGSIVLYGRHGRTGEPSFELDTCLVVASAERIEPHPPGPPGADLLDDAVLGPLFTEMDGPAPLTVYRGRSRAIDGGGPFSFVPAMRAVGDDLPLFPRPTLRPVRALEGVVNPAKMQAIKTTPNVTRHDRDAVWDEVVRQVTAQGCGLGHHLAAPPVLDTPAAVEAIHGPPHAFGQ